MCVCVCACVYVCVHVFISLRMRACIHGLCLGQYIACVYMFVDAVWFILRYMGVRVCLLTILLFMSMHLGVAFDSFQKQQENGKVVSPSTQ